MLLGIVCEGPRDTSPLKRLIEKSISHFSIQPPLAVNFKQPYVTNGPIFSKLSAAVSTLIIPPVPDAIIFYSDVDIDKGRRTALNNWIRDNEHLMPGIPGLPFLMEPHFEELFIGEHNSMINYLNLSPEEEIPYPGDEPKSRIQKIINDKRDTGHIDYTLLDDEIYAEIVNDFNLNNLARISSDFNTFQQALRNFSGNRRQT